MFDRSTGTRALGAITAVLVIGLAAAGGAAAREATVPADAPTVITGPSGAALIAFVHGRDLCFALQARGSTRPKHVPDHGVSSFNPAPDGTADVGGCADMPVLTETGGAVLAGSSLIGRRPDGTRGDGVTVQLGVTGTGIAAAQAKRDGTVVGAAETVPSPLPGAADLRFFLIERPADAPAADEVALLDAAGTVRRGLALDGEGSDPGAGTGSDFG
ncbi:MAG TPA: hypothetical protein VNT55_21105, partial [Baekduia sp.]|nr:hypothetical protein [Baekduia sp.]